MPRLAIWSDRQLPISAPSKITLPLRLATPADAVWRAVLDQDEAAMAAVDPSAGPVYLLIEREEEGVAVRRLPLPAWQFTRRLCAGETLQQVLDQAAGEMSSIDEINALLADHLARARFIAIGELRS